MKKLFLGLLCLIMALLAPVSVQAEGLSMEAEVDVTVTYTEEELQGSIGLETGGTITLQDGTEVTVKPGSSADSDIRIAVVPVTQKDAEAYAHVMRSMETYGEKPYAFYILFYRDGKETVPSVPVTLAVTAPDGYRESTLYSFVETGAVQEAARKPVGSAWTFIALDSRYFAAVLSEADQTEPSTEPEETEPSAIPGSEDEKETSTTSAIGMDGNSSGTGQKAQGSAAKTGDETPVGLWLLAFAVSYCILLMVLGKRRKIGRKT